MITDEQLSDEFKLAMHNLDAAKLECVGVAAKIECRIRQYRRDLRTIFDQCESETWRAIDDGDDDAAYEATRLLCAVALEIGEL